MLRSKRLKPCKEPVTNKIIKRKGSILIERMPSEDNAIPIESRSTGQFGRRNSSPRQMSRAIRNTPP